MIYSNFNKGFTSNVEMANAVDALNKIPASLPYSDWFRVAGALKNTGLAFKIFDDWSRTCPEKYDAVAARKVWDGAAAPDKPHVTAGTLNFLAAQYEKLGEAPEMLSVPEDDDVLFRQASDFIERLYHEGEFFEVVTTTRITDKGRKIPARSPETLEQRPEVTDSWREQIADRLKDAKDGAWISLNPLREHLQGAAPSDADVTDFRYALIEADDLTKEEQWAKLCALNLPIKSVVWSGGKSLLTYA